MDEQAYIEGFMKVAHDRGLTPEQAQGLAKQAGLGKLLPRLGWMGLGGLGLYGGLSLQDAIEDTQKTEHQKAIEAMLETSRGMPSDQADSYISRYLKDLMQKRYSDAKEIYNLR